MQALERFSFGGSTIKETVVAQSRILLFWYYTTYLLLERNKPKYQQLEQPPADQTEKQPKLEPLDSDPEEQYEQIESPLLDQGKPDQGLESSCPGPLNMFELEGF